MEIRGEKLDAIGISSEQVDKKYVDSMTVSYGYVFSSEEKWNSVYDIAKAADKRMYKSKANFYREKERDRNVFLYLMQKEDSIRHMMRVSL